MGHNFWHMVNRVIAEADLLIEVVDARMIEETRNKEIERKVKAKEKHLILVINKCDLVDKSILEVEKKRLEREGIETVFLSSKKHLGNTILKRKLLRFAKKEIRVGLLGYPNTGKSSVINVLKGISAAPTSSTSNFTRAVRNVRVANNIMLIDTPGVYPSESKDEVQLALMCVRSAEQIKEPDLAAQKILELFVKHKPDTIEKQYGVTVETDDTEELLEAIALKRNKLRKGGEPDINTMAKIIITDWQKGKISFEGALLEDAEKDKE